VREEDPPACRALIFDLDGTLVDSSRDIAHALNAALAAQGHETLELATILPMIGDGARALVTRALAAQGITDDTALLDAMMSSFQHQYVEEPCVHTRLMPGAAQALAVGVPRAVVTNKPRPPTLLVLERLGILELFSAVWAGGDGKAN
jgi:phosphoglycolate phosphatase